MERDTRGLLFSTNIYIYAKGEREETNVCVCVCCVHYIYKEVDGRRRGVGVCTAEVGRGRQEKRTLA